MNSIVEPITNSWVLDVQFVFFKHETPGTDQKTNFTGNGNRHGNSNDFPRLLEFGFAPPCLRLRTFEANAKWILEVGKLHGKRAGK